METADVRGDAREAARMIRGLLGQVESGVMSCPTGLVGGLAGAAVALEKIADLPASESDDSATS